MTQLVEKKHVKYGRTYTRKYAIIYPIKKNGERYANPIEYEAYGNEQTQEDVLVRLQENNPTRRYEIA